MYFQRSVRTPSLLGSAAARFGGVNVFVIPVLAALRGRITQQRLEIHALHASRHRHTSHGEDRRRQINVQGHVLAASARRGRKPGIANDQRHTDGFLIHEPFAFQRMRAIERAVVGHVNDHGVVIESLLSKAWQIWPTARSDRLIKAYSDCSSV